MVTPYFFVFQIEIREMTSSNSLPVSQDDSSDHFLQNFGLSEGDQDEQPVKHRAKRSLVWEYYIDGPVREGLFHYTTSSVGHCELDFFIQKRSFVRRK